MKEFIIPDIEHGDSSEISPKRKNEITKMAEDIYAMETFFDHVEIRESAYRAVSKLYPVFDGGMQNDLIRSGEHDWRERPEYFRRIFDTFVLSDPKEMKLFFDIKRSL